MADGVAAQRLLLGSHLRHQQTYLEERFVERGMAIDFYKQLVVEIDGHGQLYMRWVSTL